MRLAPSAGNSFCNGYIDHASLRMTEGEKNEKDFIVTSCSLPILPPHSPIPPPPVLENRTLTPADEATTRFRGAQDITKVMMDPSCIE